MAADAQHVLEHDAGLTGGLQGLRQHDVIKSVVRIVGEIGVGVTLDHGEALGDALVDTFARQLDAAPVDATALQQLEEFAVAAADIEHARPGIDHVGDEQMVDAEIAGAAGGLRHRQIAPDP
jgi:hypothetical protein